jgi:hypothetical protein
VFLSFPPVPPLDTGSTFELDKAFCLLLKVVQSVLVRYPFTLVVAAGILIVTVPVVVGVLKGAVPVILETPLLPPVA